MTQKIEISYRTIVFTVFFLLGLVLLYEIRQIIVALFVSVILISALNPVVNKLERYRIPRLLAILLIYLLIIGSVGVALAMIIPSLIDQTELFISRMIPYVKDVGLLGISLDSNIITNQISQLGSVPANLLKFVINLFSNLFGIFALIIITFYLLVERKNLNKYLLILFGEGQEKKAEEFVDKVEKRLGDWVRGEFILMSTIGLMTFIGLTLLGVEVALPLAILSGLLEIVPNIGPIISAVPAMLVGLTVSPVMTLAIAALYLLVQQSENSFITPKVMQKTVGVNPLITILALTIGGKIGGIMGAVLAIPFLLVVQVISVELFSSKRFQNL
ncbi:hypothetical protein COT44_00395 [Candidatus Shapirobacteria bacterium CG08_land_8_20_14_0_20_39_18]|uniref:AI-2E family transporter n=1 Tax=Candidatus Shapirobacteria bacterium CG08_land_8_20_14_0_20_39_18 TaxID=1974883 RepID=A0A2M6XE93_9BACT|nr:MAG: hypothetical protein COT44_00395 [Candidatus Shapirobacteria bacterium CG08_land_8_20_14_0_20_39_18]PIY64726.1 MAG: hypothetical protein COY91_04635 [Candidatus Shapirobacteria bacterium CG_4_10_14_0_8_um_filter_39_15]PJE68424.1 MAG: hypothetical protein COU94_02160 [Candidatus Shapirobacteria bacterium CG10_big_fil_rev_8_21_14_0_10_38_8]